MMCPSLSPTHFDELYILLIRKGELFEEVHADLKIDMQVK